MLGIEQQLDPGIPLTGNAYEQESNPPPERQLATNLRDAIRDLDQSAARSEERRVGKEGRYRWSP